MTSQLYAAKQHTYLTPWFEDVSGAQMHSLGLQSGLSGAVVWRVSLGGRDLCLRRWPQVYPTRDGLKAIHGLLRHIEQAGFHLAPTPLPTRDGETIFVNEDHFWELTPWMPGEASFREKPSPEKLASALASLAEFHHAAKLYSFSGQTSRVDASPGLRQRLEILHSLQQGELERLRQATGAAESSDLRELALELVEGVARPLAEVCKQLEQIVAVPLPLQWCLRDVRCDHLLFADDQVTGLVDFGAAAVDSVAGDVARLLGSMVNDFPEYWQYGLKEYEKHRPLAFEERRAIATFDAAGVLCSAANWVRWLYVEGKTFPQVRTLTAQLNWLRDRLWSLGTTAF